MHFLKSIRVQLVLVHHSPPPHALERLLTSAISAHQTTAATTTPERAQNIRTWVSDVKSFLQPWFNVYVFVQLLFSCCRELKQSRLSLRQLFKVDCPEELKH